MSDDFIQGRHLQHLKGVTATSDYQMEIKSYSIFSSIGPDMATEWLGYDQERLHGLRNMEEEFEFIFMC